MDDYAALVDQVYITPIRSVVALDDQFPTLDRLLDSKVSPLEAIVQDEETVTVARVPVNPDEIGRAKSLVAYCRDRQWIVDIHDGSQVLKAQGEASVLQHLHQTDLLVLDYRLKGETFGGDHAIEILRALSKNPHFNIVVVYTKDDIVGTFREIALSLLRPHTFSSDHDDEVSGIWQEWVDEDAAAMATLEQHFDSAVYLYFRKSRVPPDWADLKKQFPGVMAFNAAVGQKIGARGGCTLKAQDFGWWLLKKVQATLQSKLFTGGASNVNSMRAPTTDVNWLRTDNLFLTVVSKDVEGATIIDRLRGALCEWRPSPHRLIVSTMRAELEDRGGSIEELALQNVYLQAGLLKRLVQSTGESRAALLMRILEQHWSEILRAMKVEVLPHAKKIIETETQISGGTADGTVLRHYSWYDAASAEQKNRMTLALNSYVSTQQIDGHHLATGQVFDFEGERWICLSPICDLEPEQNKDKRWFAKVGDAMPFKAVKLLHIPDATAIKYAKSSLCLFLKIGDEMKCYGFLPMGGDQGDPNPHWEQMFASKQGVFGADNSFELSAVRTGQDNKPFLTPPQTTQVVAQLKYEYALNLLQRLGSNLTRVGLDYIDSV
jgi:CheY-like chemotaxis protein